MNKTLTTRRKFILTHINTLIQRERYGIISSGTQIWTILALIIGITYDLILKVKSIASHNSLVMVIVSFCIIFNLCNSIQKLLNSQFRNTKIPSMNTNTDSILESQKFKIGHSTELILMIFPFLANMYVFFSVNITIVTKIVCFLFLCRYSLYYLMILLIFIKKHININNFSLSIREIISQAKQRSLPNKQDHDTYITQLLSIVAFIFLCMAIFSICQILYTYNNEIIENIDIIAYSLKILGLWLCLDYLPFIIIKAIKISWLIAFEQKILREDLDDNEIETIFHREILNGSNIESFF